jgi:ABC-2 type transport system permease protein/sodium transport system permease protein
LGRLTLKELREILRDRRTIVTLVLMPLFMYPVMSIAFQQFFVSQLTSRQTPRYELAFQNADEGRYFSYLLQQAGVEIRQLRDEEPAAGGRPIVVVGIWPDLAGGLENREFHVALHLDTPAPLHDRPQRDLAVDVDLMYVEDWAASRDAAAYVEEALAEANGKFLAARLKDLGVSQRAEPIRVLRRPIRDESASSGTVSITAVVPFILILMTVTGAVYPAIDLTAGERERGTLEMLVAAPIPRFGVLLAKYVAVLAVALLTAAANLLTMTVTIMVSGLGKALFGEAGMSAGVIAAVFGLLLLFAAFFSAVLLAITSSARSFKEAQAYLIPLMLVSLAPGMLSLMPDVELSGLLLVTPLANIVLLGRDLLALKAGGAATTTVVASTLLYAAAAIAVAARIFGSESVLYSTQSGWSDLFRRPRVAQSAPSVTAAFVTLALVFPAYFLLLGLSGHLGDEVGPQQVLMVVITAVVFGGIPWVACRVRRVPIAPAFRLPVAAPAVFFGAALMGLASWTVSEELVLVIHKLRGAVVDPKLVEVLSAFAAKLRTLPVAVVLLTMAVVPAFFEEFFFRGYLFAALGSRTTPATTIFATALLFGFFHVVAPNPLASERLASSTLVGLVLGWVRWRSGSLLPGIVLHTLHNGIVVLLAYYKPELEARGIGISESHFLPAGWVAGGAAAACLGALVLFAATRRK